MTFKQQQKRIKSIIEKLKSANPEHADRFRTGANEQSVLFDVDNNKSAILYSVGLDGKFYDCQMDGGGYPTIEKRE